MIFFIGFGLGLVAGVGLHVYLTKLPAPILDHAGCEERYERVTRQLRRRVYELEREVQNLIAGLA